MKRVQLSRRNILRNLLVVPGFFLPRFLNTTENKEDICEAELKNLYLMLVNREMSEKISLFRNLIKSYGSGIIDVVCENTVSQAAERLRTAEIPVRDLNAILENLWYHTEYTHSYSVEEHTGRLLKLRVTRCLFAEEMRKHKAEEIGDAFYCAYDYGFCHGLNPDISFSRSKTLMKGHDCCDHSYTLIIK